MHDTGTVSTFEKYTVGNDLLTPAQMESIARVQTFLRSAGIEKSQEELALLLKFVDPGSLGKALADIKAKWKISIPRPRVFTIAPEKDLALQKSLAAKGPDLAGKVVECQKIREGLKKLGLQLSVAEVLIAKGYYTPPQLQAGAPALRPAEDEPPAPQASGPKKGTSVKPKPRRAETKEAPGADDEAAARKKKLVFVAAVGGGAACLVLVLAVVLLSSPPPRKKPGDPAVAAAPLEEPPPDAPKPAEPPKPPEPEKPRVEVPAPPPEKPFDPAPPKEDPIPAPADAPREPTPEPPLEPSKEPPKEEPAAPAPEPFDPAQGKPAEPPQEAPQDEKSAKRAEREQKAEKLYADAKKLIEGGRWAEALEALKSLRDRYTDTAAFLKNTSEVSDQIVECGYRLAAAGLAKQTLSKKQHVDTILGFQFTPPDGWRGIPNWQDLFGQRDTSEANYKDRSLRCARYTSRWLETVYIDTYKTYAPTGPEGIAEGALKIYTRDYSGLKEVSSASWPHPRYQAIKRVHADDEGNRLAVYAFYDPGSKKGFGLVGYWRASRDSGIVIVEAGGKFADKKKPCSDADWELATKVFDQVAKTLLVYDQQSLSAMRQQAKGRPEAPDGWYVRCADFSIHVTPNYVIEYATRKDFAERLGKELENILALYKRVIPTAKPIAKGRVKLFDCEEDFLYYGQAYGAAAYWSPAQREIVAYRFEGREVKVGEQGAGEKMTVAEERNPEEVTFNIIYHEAFHQYMENIMGISRDVYVPSWLNEGMGDYFFGGRWLKNGKFEIGWNDWRLETIVNAVKENKHVPLRDIFTYTQQDYYRNAGLCYAEGWAINYFFQSEEGKKKGYHLIALRFFEELKKSGDFKRVNQKILAYDFAKMEEEWKAFVLGLEKLLPKKADAEKKEPEKKEPPKR